MLKQSLRRSRIYHPLRNWVIKRQQRRALARWNPAGDGPPPHAVKQAVLRGYAEQFGLRVFVETGTFYGDMVEAMKPFFDELYSIELSKDLFDEGRRRFRTDSHVRLLNGDSATTLGDVVRGLRRPTLFWLDGHYSAGITARGKADTPIREELDHVLGLCAFPYVIVIDDARCFGRQPGYPSLEDLTAFVRSRRPDMSIMVEADMIRITPDASLPQPM